jgi:hypothetical protein
MTISLTLASLIADFVGVCFIAWSYFSSGSKHLRELASSKRDLNTELLHSLCEAKADNMIGFGFLFVGFGLQIVATAFPGMPTWLAAIALSVTLVASALAIFARHRLIGRIEQSALPEAPSGAMPPHGTNARDNA